MVVRFLINYFLLPVYQSLWHSPVEIPEGKTDPDFFPTLPVREPTRQRSKESVESRNPREHQITPNISSREDLLVSAFLRGWWVVAGFLSSGKWAGTKERLIPISSQPSQ
jgi:hypothetical protein